MLIMVLLLLCYYRKIILGDIEIDYYTVRARFTKVKLTRPSTNRASN